MVRPVSQPRQILLLGEGPFHCALLRGLARRRPARNAVTLMVPQGDASTADAIAGAHLAIHSRPLLNLNTLALAAGLRFLQDTPSALNRQEKFVRGHHHPAIAYDVCSIDLPLVSQRPAAAETSEFGLPLHPLSTWPNRCRQLLHTARLQLQEPAGYHLLIHGVSEESLRLAVLLDQTLSPARRHRPYRSRHRSHKGNLKITLVSSEPLDEEAICSRGIESALQKAIARKIQVLSGCVLLNLTDQGEVTLSGGTTLLVDELIWAEQARPPGWLENTGLGMQSQGFFHLQEDLVCQPDPHIILSPGMVNRSPLSRHSQSRLARQFFRRSQQLTGLRPPAFWHRTADSQGYFSRQILRHEERRARNRLKKRNEMALPGFNAGSASSWQFRRALPDAGCWGFLATNHCLTHALLRYRDLTSIQVQLDLPDSSELHPRGLADQIRLGIEEALGGQHPSLAFTIVSGLDVADMPRLQIQLQGRPREQKREDAGTDEDGYALVLSHPLGSWRAILQPLLGEHPHLPLEQCWQHLRMPALSVCEQLLAAGAQQLIPLSEKGLKQDLLSLAVCGWHLELSSTLLNDRDCLTEAAALSSGYLALIPASLAENAITQLTAAGLSGARVIGRAGRETDAVLY